MLTALTSGQERKEEGREGTCYIVLSVKLLLDSFMKITALHNVLIENILKSRVGVHQLDT